VSDTPQVSVLLPVRDGASTLELALGSVLASRNVALEVVCVDDGSRDATPALLARAAEGDARVRVLRTEARGITAALNAGLTAARAPVVARMDADDEMLPERLEAQLALLDPRPDLALVGCGVEPFRAGGLAAGWRIYAEWVNGLVTPEAIEREAFVECPVPHPTWMFRRDVIVTLGGYRDVPWPEDLDLFYRLLEARRRAGKVPRVLHRWRDHDARLSRRDPRYAREAFAAAKAHFLPRVHGLREVVVWGAGKTGRRFARLLRAEGVEVRAFLEVRPDRAGTLWRGIPILAPADLETRASEWRAAGIALLGAVASRGARAEIRAALRGAGLAEGRDFWMVA
jgi:glycosyltransferase involved in cell wall biosynthesis